MAHKKSTRTRSTTRRLSHGANLKPRGGYRTYREAKEFVQALNFKTAKEYKTWATGKLDDKPERPDDIPKSPDNAYCGYGWSGYGDYLGTGRGQALTEVPCLSSKLMPFETEFRCYEEAKICVQSIGIKDAKEYCSWAAGKLPEKAPTPADIPSCPHQIYKGYGWTGYGDYLGTGRVAHYRRVFLSFEKAREFAQELDLRTSMEWSEYSAGRMPWLPDRPDSIPSNPSITYKDSGWISMPDWLGTNRASYTIDSKFWSFERARDFARKLELKSYLEWRDYTQGRNQTLGPKLEYIPSLPHVRYKAEGWIDYPDWLGYEKHSTFHREAE